ncbi:hypothetical protein OHA71_23730 [Streptomyces sp. NBC_00444]|uniref:hypothetical protein n=1 Tax=Streptomyces sp. NBC_00444 TaxID=2975744 RepID=UPI002E1DB1FE
MSAPTTVQWLRTAVSRVYVGSGRLTLHYAARAAARARSVGRRITDWVGASSGLWWLAKVGLLLWLAGRARLILAAFAERAYARVDSGAWGWLLWSAAALWVIGAYRAGRDGWEPKQRPQPEPAADVDDEPAPVVSLVKPPPVSPVALVAAVRDIGTPHAQLKPLAEHLGTTTDAVRAAAARMGWAVKDVRMQGRSSTQGLRWDEAPSLAEVHPLPGVVGAGHPADDDNDDADGPQPEKGLRVERIGLSGTVVHNLADAVRPHTVRDH